MGIRGGSHVHVGFIQTPKFQQFTRQINRLYASGLYETYPIRNPGPLIPEWNIYTASHSHPRVTYYRLLVFVVIFSFGTLKAILAHVGDQTEANWIDWAVVVGATSM